MKINGMDRAFMVIGENVHTTRALIKRNKRVNLDENGGGTISYVSRDGTDGQLPIPENITATQDFQEGRVKHVKAALHQAMHGAGDLADIGLNYIRAIVEHQEDAGADFLDINVDEVSLKKEEQIEAMQWLTDKVQGMATRPLSIDSSDIDVIAAGLAVYDGCNGPPMLTPASMEKGIAANDIYLDPLVFPVAVDPEYGRDCLNAIRQIRERFGPEIHITGGISNASFGVPGRKFINEAFLRLAVEAGGDSGIMDPVQNDPAAALAPIAPGAPSQGVAMAMEVVLGQDKDCAAYIKAWRKKVIR